MKTLKEGSSGPEVVKLQKKLKTLGYNPGSADGDFGPATKAAVIGFQRSQGLLADGVAGPRTLTAMGLMDDPSLPPCIASVTSTMVSKMFPFTQVDSIKRNLPFVLQALEEYGITDKPMVLMALASIRAETEGFEPISEGKSKYNTSPGGHSFDLYDNRSDLGNQGVPDGEKFKGRGFIQLTGRANYQKHGKAIGLGNKLITNPELANDPKTAARLLTSFLKNKERAIKEALLENDLRLARRLVNGGSHGLDRFTNAYQIGEELIT
ncbi:MAG: peptidoglycan-binding protein [Bacteroidetes bacterium]|nr:peptidoglycan-binding protein [Bacteroidota bacterium]